MIAHASFLVSVTSSTDGTRQTNRSANNQDRFRRRGNRSFAVLLLALSLAGCFDSSTNQIDCGDTNAFNQIDSLLAEKATFDEIFIPVDTILLQTTEESILGAVSQAERHPDGYVLLDHHNARIVYLFDGSGNFVRQLGSNGQGPGEYENPRFLLIDRMANTHILEPTLQKILTYSREGHLLDETFFRELGIRPSAFFITGEQNDQYVFYNIDGDFMGASRGQKIIVTQRTGNRLEYRYAFGKPEPLLSRLSFDMGTFALTKNQNIWLSEVFGLGIEIYALDGTKRRTINGIAGLLPKPHVSTQALEKFDRLSNALETYYTLARAYKHLFLDDLVVGIYHQNPKTHFVFLDYCGNVFPRILTTEAYPFPSGVIGSWANRVYFFRQREAEAGITGMLPNPMLIGYKIQRF